MTGSESTRWSMIRGAAGGEEAAAAAFAERYEPVMRAYLGARWRRTPLLQDVDDAVQEVFLDCFKNDGALERADPARGGFRAFLYGVVRNVALNLERRRARQRVRPANGEVDLDRLPADEDGLSTVFDRAYAMSLLRQASERQAKSARKAGEGACRRVDLLRLRFSEGRPIREIARLWDEDPARLHHEYARARQEFRAALLGVVAAHHPGSPREVERECSRILDVLS